MVRKNKRQDRGCLSKQNCQKRCSLKHGLTDGQLIRGFQGFEFLHVYLLPFVILAVTEQITFELLIRLGY